MGIKCMDVWRNDGSREGKKTVSSKNVGQSITHHREARNEKGAAVKLHLIKLCFMMACLLGRAQINLTLLSLRCAIARVKIKIVSTL